MEMWQLYLLEVLPSIKTVSIMLSSVSIVFLVSYLVCAISDDIELKEILSEIKWLVFAITMFVIISILVPTREGLYRIIGGYYLTNIEGVEQLPPNIVKATNKFLEQFSEDE